MEKQLELLTLAEIKESLGASELRVVDSNNMDENGEPLRGTVYHGNTKLGIVKKGLTAKDLKENDSYVVAVKNPELGWVFTVRKGEFI